jgi:hypothetical protein
MNRSLLTLAWLTALGAMPLAAQETRSGPVTTSSPVRAPAPAGAAVPTVVNAPVIPATSSPVSVDGEGVETAERIGPRGQLMYEPIPPAAASQTSPSRPSVNAPTTLAPAQTPPTRPVSAPAPPVRR